LYVFAPGITCEEAKFFAPLSSCYSSIRECGICAPKNFHDLENEDNMTDEAIVDTEGYDWGDEE
jgi:hypothetical protein